MNITIHSPFKAKPSLNRAGFIAVLERQGSFASDPAWDPTPREKRVDEAGRIYDYIVRQDEDPGRWLAIFGKESTFGTNSNSVLHRGNTRSLTNARSIRHPDVSGEIYHDPERNSQYVRYQSLYDSVRDGIYRIYDPMFAYQQAGATTIAEVMAIFAPASDANDPEGYAQTMVRWVNEWSKEFPVEGENTMRDQHATWKPSSNYTEGRGGKRVRWIILHTTEGGYLGSLNWLRGAAGNTSNRNSSSHYILDRNGGQLAQLVDERDTAWTAGNWGYNQQSVNIEMEGYAGRGGFTDGLYQAVGALVARIAERHGLGINRDVVIGHGDVPNQDHWDPGPHFDFERVLRIARESTEPNVPCRYVAVTGHYLCHGFRGYWESRDNPNEDGWPISEEFDLDGLTVQYFERARYEWQPAIANNPHGVVRGRLGAESIEQLKEQFPEAFAPQDPPERTA